MRVILHVDMNAYFASVEQKADPKLRGKPIAVVGDLKRRGIVLTASYEARRYGVKTGLTCWEAKRLCPPIIPVLGDPKKYLAQTEEIFAILDHYTDQVEVVGIDEAYLDATGSLNLFQTDGEGMAKLIQNRIKAELSLPCSVGVAPNKLLSKLASDMKKPLGITVIKPQDVSRVLCELPVEKICGIGPRLREALAGLGIKTCGQLGKFSLETLQSRFGVWGSWMKNWGQGLDESPVRRKDDAEAVKSMGHSTTLPRDTSERRVIESFLLLLSEKVGMRLRRGGFMGRTVTATVRFHDFKSMSKSVTLQEPLCEGLGIYKTALAIFDRMGTDRALRLLGVSVSNLVSDRGAPYLLEELEKGRRIATTMDEINEKWGKGAVKRGRVMEAEKFGILEAPVPPRLRRFY